MVKWYICLLITESTKASKYRAKSRSLWSSRDAVSLNLQAGPDLDYQDREQQSTALHFAAWDGRLEVTKLLLQAGASLEIRAAGGATPLHAAARRGFTDVAIALLAHGANPNASTDKGYR